jgi:uncharacterized protein YdeI (YjbR/CyaY-like superfamily)
MPELKRVRPKSRSAWRGWLERHHAASPGIWLVFAKKHTGLATLSYEDAVQEALCFGWIDSLVKSIDDRFHMQMFTPRKPKSAWAQSNKTRVARLIDQGLMTPAGLAAIEAAKACGSWDALTAAESLTVPSELEKAIAANARASKNWPAFTASQRKQFLFYLASAKRAETRRKRIAEIVNFAARNITPAQAYDARRARSQS